MISGKLAEMAELFRRDPDLHLFDVSCSPYDSPLKGHPRVFGKAGHQIHVLDSFMGKRPAILNHAFLSSSALYELRFAVTFILDSQLVSALHQYRMQGGLVEPGDKKAAIESFLQYVSQLKYDFNPVFYFLESLHKSTAEEFLRAVRSPAASLLYLHSMDEVAFLRTGEMRLKPEAVEHYCTMYGAASLEECGEAAARRFLESSRSAELIAITRVIYLYLLKMTLIHKKDAASIATKFEQYQAFTMREVGVNLARESHLAACYFADLVGGFLPVQPGMDFNKAKHALAATAWDLLLMRLPEQLLNPETLPELILAYVCTLDKQLAEVSSLFTFQAMLKRSDDGAMTGPVLALDLQRLERKIQPQRVREIHHIVDRHLAERSVRHPNPPPPRPDRIEALIADHEMQLAVLCRRH